MHRNIVSAAIILVSFIFSGQPRLVYAQVKPENPPPQDFVAGEVLVIYAQSEFAQRRTTPKGALMDSEGLLTEPIAGQQVVKYSVPVGQEKQFVDRFNQLPGVLFAEPNYIVSAQEIIPDDPGWSGSMGWTYINQWGPRLIHADFAWERTTGSPDVTIAILDSGIDSIHPEFNGRLLPGYDFIEMDNDPQDQCGHGTHVTGIAAATGNNSEGIAGIDWQARILPVRVLAANCNGTIEQIVAGLNWAASQGADIINMSLGTSTNSFLLQNTIQNVFAQGIVLVAAAGNYGQTDVLYPARYPGVLAVGSINSQLQPAPSSHTGPNLDVMAPGINIISTDPGGDYFSRSGTSMASPHAAGAAGLLLAAEPGLRGNPQAVYDRLQSTALDLDIPGRDNLTGYGLIQLEVALGLPPAPPLPPEVDYEMVRCSAASIQWLTPTAGDTRLLVLNGTNSSGLIQVPANFGFSLGGRNLASNSLRMSSNGFLTVDGTSSLPNNETFVTTHSPHYLIAPYWDALIFNPSSRFEAWLINSSPNRRIIATWENASLAAAPQTRLSFQVVLEENSSQIWFKYGQEPQFDGASATIGLKYRSNPLANSSDIFRLDQLVDITHAFNQTDAVQPNESILFVPFPYGTERNVLNCNLAQSINLTTGTTCNNNQPASVQIDSNSPWLPKTPMLHIDFLDRYFNLPQQYLSFNRFSQVTIEPDPDPPIVPRPRICFTIPAALILEAGGRGENLRIGVYQNGSWQMLPSDFNAGDMSLTTEMTGFDVYGIFAARPGSSGENNLPVTGSNQTGNLHENKGTDR